MLEVIALLTVGVFVGRLWAWLRVETQITECPRCAVEDQKQRTLMEISAIRRVGEEQMRDAAAHRSRSLAVTALTNQRVGGGVSTDPDSPPSQGACSNCARCFRRRGGHYSTSW